MQSAPANDRDHLFEERDGCPTPIGAPSLRWHRHLRPGVDVPENRLGEDVLMTRHFTDPEVGRGAACGEGPAEPVMPVRDAVVMRRPKGAA